MPTKPKYAQPLTPGEMAALDDSDIDFSDIPELDDAFWAKAVLRSPPAKQPVSIRLDQHVLEYFKAQGAGYQTLINSVLRSYVETKRRAGSVTTKKRAAQERSGVAEAAKPFVRSRPPTAKSAGKAAKSGSHKPSRKA